MFTINDYIVYPGHGVACVSDIIEKMVSGSMVIFFKLDFVFKDMTILVPVNNVAANGLRYTNDYDAIRLALEELKQGPSKKLEYVDFTPSGWNRRNKEYQIRIQGGKFIDLVKIYRDLMLVSQKKELSFGEKAVLQNIEDLILQEMRIVNKCEMENLLQLLRGPFTIMKLHDACEVHQDSV